MLALTPNGQKSFTISVIFQVCVTFMLGGIPAIAPLVVQSLGVHDSATGIFLGICYLGTTLMSLLSGVAIRRYGPVRMSQVSCLLGAAGVLLCLAPSLALVAIGGFVIGLCDGSIMPAASDLITHNVEKEHWSMVLSVKQASAPIGTAVAGFLLPWVATEFSWQAAVFFCAAVGLAVVFYTQRFQKEFDNHDDKTAHLTLSATKEALGMVLRSEELRPLAIVSLIYEGAQICLLGFLVVAMNMQRGFSLVFAGYILAALNVGAVVGRIFFGYLDSKLHRAHLQLAFVGIVMGLLICALLTMKAGDSAGLVLLLSFVTGMVSLGWKGVFLSVVAQKAPEGRISEATGGVDFFSFAGAIFAPVVLGVIDYATESYLIAYGVIGLSCSAAGAWLLFQKKGESSGSRA